MKFHKEKSELCEQIIEFYKLNRNIPRFDDPESNSILDELEIKLNRSINNE
jgi:hypothetical protein